MDMAISNMPKKVGEISGEFGDTLFASYTLFKVAIKKTYKNPMAFLKRGDDLILGNGEITLGASHFVNDAAIDFDRVKYKFTAVECVDENK
jgi:hypothetical protein